jgi:hypothetical protein
MTARFRARLAPGSAIDRLVGVGHIEAALNVWTLGEHIFDNGHGAPGFLKPLEPPPPDIWEFRITHPEPQVRIFGRFAEPDTFVATDIQTRGSLGRKGSPAWQRACAQCAKDWQGHFPNQSPYVGPNRRISDYVTENCDDFSI